MTFNTLRLLLSNSNGLLLLLYLLLDGYWSGLVRLVLNWLLQLNFLLDGYTWIRISRLICWLPFLRINFFVLRGALHHRLTRLFLFFLSLKLLKNWLLNFIWSLVSQSSEKCLRNLFAFCQRKNCNLDVQLIALERALVKANFNLVSYLAHVVRDVERLESQGNWYFTFWLTENSDFHLFGLVFRYRNFRIFLSEENTLFVKYLADFSGDLTWGDFESLLGAFNHITAFELDVASLVTCLWRCEDSVDVGEKYQLLFYVCTSDTIEKLWHIWSLY
jgi:hypothetical protein